MMNFDNSDVDFMIDDENYLVIGQEILFESDLMTQIELKEWAESNDYEYDSFDEIIKFKNRYDLENGNELSTPHSRAFEFFRDLDFIIPESLGLELIDGSQPGGDLQAVKLTSKEILTQLQGFLLENQIKANFKLNS